MGEQNNIEDRHAEPYECFFAFIGVYMSTRIAAGLLMTIIDWIRMFLERTGAGLP